VSFFVVVPSTLDAAASASSSISIGVFVIPMVDLARLDILDI
jgi:hypothetical protein